MIDSFGYHGDVTLTSENHQKWKIEGQIRKINVKSRTWDDRHIIQGIQVFMANGETKAFGMELNDTLRVETLEVPAGEHIKDFYVRSGFYIDAFGLKTNKGKVIGPIGGTGGSQKHGYQFVSNYHYYIDGIEGKTVTTQGGPSICEIKFKYVEVFSHDKNEIFDHIAYDYVHHNDNDNDNNSDYDSSDFGH